VLTPTRELAKQVGEDFLSVAPRLTTLCVYGGVGTHPQKDELRRGVDVVVGTPGRVMDLMECSALKLEKVAHVVLDEADRMLDMGFAEDVNKILSAVPGMAGFSAGAKAVQFILFSATIPDWVRQMSKKHMVDPAMIDLVQGQEASLDVRHLVSAFFFQLHLTIL
jgi:ATP-dependent RNA helicase DDX21